jgi:hypothetical protein
MRTASKMAPHPRRKALQIEPLVPESHENAALMGCMVTAMAPRSTVQMIATSALRPTSVPHLASPSSELYNSLGVRMSGVFCAFPTQTPCRRFNGRPMFRASVHECRAARFTDRKLNILLQTSRNSRSRTKPTLSAYRSGTYWISSTHALSRCRARPCDGAFAQQLTKLFECSGHASRSSIETPATKQ